MSSDPRTTGGQFGKLVKKLEDAMGDKELPSVLAVGQIPPEAQNDAQRGRAFIGEPGERQANYVQPKYKLTCNACGFVGKLDEVRMHACAPTFTAEEARAMGVPVPRTASRPPPVGDASRAASFLRSFGELDSDSGFAERVRVLAAQFAIVRDSASATNERDGDVRSDLQERGATDQGTAGSPGPVAGGTREEDPAHTGLCGEHRIGTAENHVAHRSSDSVRSGLDTAPAHGVVTFEAAWAEKEREGYQYGRDALEQVRFGWELHAKHRVPGSASTTVAADLLARIERRTWLVVSKSDLERWRAMLLGNESTPCASPAVQTAIAKTPCVHGYTWLCPHGCMPDLTSAPSSSPADDWKRLVSNLEVDSELIADVHGDTDDRISLDRYVWDELVKLAGFDPNTHYATDTKRPEQQEKKS